MAFRPLNVVGGWYTDDALPWVQQDICNFIPVISEMPGPISAIKAVDAPGLKPFVEIASNGGIRGLHDAEGKLMVVAGTRLYQITNTGFALPCGAIPGSGPVTMSHNQQGIANEVLIGNGSAGYVYNTATRAFNRITDPGFPGIKASDYLDSFLLGVEPLGRFWFHSNLADAESYNTLDRYEAETSPDRIVTLAVSNEEVVVLGERTTDFFVNTGAATGTFQSKGVSCNVGCAGTNSIVKLDNTLMWLDNYGVFQRLDGYTPTPISTRALESAIAQYKDRWAGVIASTYQDRGRKIAYWTIPNGPTFGYDVTTRLWHRLQSYGRTNFRAPQIVYWNKKWIAGDSQTGRLYEMDWDYMLDVDQPHVRGLKTAPLHGNGVKLQMHAARLVFDTGGPETVAIPFPVQPPPDTPAPTITGAAPDGTIGAAYAGYAYAVTGDAPLEVTMASGALPVGLEVSASGVISPNTTSVQGTFPFTLRVTDGYGRTATLEDSIKIVFSAGIVAAVVGNTKIMSGDTNAYPVVQATTIAGTFQKYVSTDDASLILCGSTNANPAQLATLILDALSGLYVAGPTFDVIPSVAINAFDMTRDGNYIAVSVAGVGGEGYRLWIYKRNGSVYNRILMLWPVVANDGIAAVQWSPDGIYLACCQGYDSAVKPSTIFKRTDDTLAEIATFAKDCNAVKWSPDGTLMSVAIRLLGLRIYHWVDEVLTSLVTGGSSDDYNGDHVWSQDGGYIYAATNRSYNLSPLAIYQWTGSALVTLTAPTQPGDHLKLVSMSPDGRLLLVGVGGQTGVTDGIWIYEANGGVLTPLAAETAGSFSGYAAYIGGR